MNIIDISHRNPFPGLRSFESDEDYLFFGREEQIDALLKLLTYEKFVSVIGASGSGKSSLIKAGLLPELYGGYMAHGGAEWQVAMYRPGAHPIQEMALALSRTDVLGSSDRALSPFQAIMIESTLKRGSLGLIEAFEQSQVDRKGKLLIVVDQFEEIFRFKKRSYSEQFDNEADAFVKLLIEATEKSPDIFVILTMRSDFLGECAQFLDLPEKINKGQFLVPRMRRDQRRIAIEGPVAVGGGEITPRLVQRLLNDVGESPDQLPILQHALMRTWETWRSENTPETPLDIRHYEAIGEMAAALSRHGDEVYNSLETKRQKHIAETLFKSLTDFGQDSRGTRRPATLEQLAGICGATNQEVEDVVNAFREEGTTFLMPLYGEKLRPETTIDISHESLMRIWERLRNWAEEEAESAKKYIRLAETAVLHGEGRALYLDGPELEEMLTWREKQNPSAPWAQRYHTGFEQARLFLEKSRVERDEKERFRKEESERALRQARAEVLRLRVLLGVILLLALLASIFALRNQSLSTSLRNANTQLSRKNDSLNVQKDSLTALSESLNVENTIQALLVDSLGAEKQRADSNFSLSELRRAFAESILDTLKKQLLINAQTLENLSASRDSLWNSRDSLRISRDSVRTALRERILRTQQLLGLELSTKALQLVDSGDIEVAAILSREAHRYDNASGNRFRNEVFKGLRGVLEVLRGTDNIVSDTISVRSTIQAVAYGPSERKALGDGIGRVFLVNLDDEPELLVKFSTRVSKLAFSTDGAVLGAISSDGDVRLWQISQNGSHSVITNLPSSLNQIHYLAFDTQLVSAYTDESLINRRLRKTIEQVEKEMGSVVTALTYTNNGLSLIAGSEDGSIGSFPTPLSPAQNLVFTDVHDSQILDIQLSPDEKILATSGADFVVKTRSWPITSSGSEHVLRGHRSTVNAIAFSSDGEWLASAGNKGSVRIWEVDNLGKSPIILEGHEARVMDLAYAPNGNKLLSGSDNEPARKWLTNTNQLLKFICSDVSRSLTPVEWTEHIGSDIPYETASCP